MSGHPHPLGPPRDAVELTAGSSVDGSRESDGLLPAGPTARLVYEAGVLVATGETAIDDADVLRLIDAGRRWPRALDDEIA